MGGYGVVRWSCRARWAPRAPQRLPGAVLAAIPHGLLALWHPTARVVPARVAAVGHRAGRASVSVTQPPNTALEATGHSVRFVASVGLYICGPRLSLGVDMTSDVKGWEQLFYVRSIVFAFCLSEEPEPVKHDG